MSDQLDLAPIKARHAAATEGPWDTRVHGVRTIGGGFFESGYSIVGPFHREGQFDSRADADFIAHAREDIPALLAEVERLQAELAEANRIAEDNQDAACTLQHRNAALVEEIETLQAQRNGLRRLAEVERERDAAVDRISRALAHIEAAPISLTDVRKITEYMYKALPILRGTEHLWWTQDSANETP